MNIEKPSVEKQPKSMLEVCEMPGDFRKNLEGFMGSGFASLEEKMRTDTKVAGSFMSDLFTYSERIGATAHPIPRAIGWGKSMGISEEVMKDAWRNRFESALKWDKEMKGS